MVIYQLFIILQGTPAENLLPVVIAFLFPNLAKDKISRLCPKSSQLAGSQNKAINEHHVNSLNVECLH